MDDRSFGQSEIKVALAGEQEVPPVKSVAAGTGTIIVGADKSLRELAMTGAASLKGK